MRKLQIDADTWATLNRLLDEALEQPAGELDGWLDALDPQFDALKPRLRALLSRASLVETGDFLHTLPKFELASDEPTASAARAEQPGSEVGPYRLLRELGTGGMGVVWLAERIDGLIHRPVALKLPHGAWKRAGLAERMAREREILGALTHPNIAHLYDAGVAADGQPFLAIEYVEGRRIDVYCDERQLDVPARVRLFTQVADAVAYAHGKLVVHRDLKPANILVDAEGRVRLLDFGIAKLLDEGEARETRVTELSGRALTPDYASPEQIRGEPLTITSDVYSLGVILYELLSGQRPYKLQRDSRGALEDAILLADPVAPSDVVPRARRKALRGDLDTIVLKALKKDPKERYLTVHALLEDIERNLGSRPVLAQPDSRWYRLRKFMARNKLGVGATAGVFIAVIAGAAVAIWQARAAVVEKVRAEQVQEFIASVFREANPTIGKGEIVSAAQLLLQAEKRLNERTEDPVDLRLELLAIIGESLFGLQENKEAARVLETALTLHESSHLPETALSARLHLGLSQTYEYLGRNDDALHELDRVLAALAAARDSASALFVRARLHEAALGIVVAEFPRAESAAHVAINAATAIHGPRSEEVATGLQQLSHVYTLTQRRTQALVPARQAFEIVLEVHASNLNHPAVIEAGQYYGHGLHAEGHFEEARVVFGDSTTRAARVFGENSRTYGEMLSSSSTLQVEIGALDEALASGRRSLEIYLLEGEPGGFAHIRRTLNVGRALLYKRDSEAAAEELAGTLRYALKANAAIETVHARGARALALAYLGQFEEADRELLLAIGTPRKVASRGQQLAMRFLGISLRLQGRPAEAMPWLDRSIEAASVAPGHRGDLANSLLEAGLVKLDLGDTAAAGDFLTRAGTLFDDVQRDRVTPARADLLVGQARLEMQRREFAAALSLLERADALWRGFDANSRWAGETALWRGRCEQALGRDARESFKRAQTLLAASPIAADAKLARLAHP